MRPQWCIRLNKRSDLAEMLCKILRLEPAAGRKRQRDQHSHTLPALRDLGGVHILSEVSEPMVQLVIVLAVICRKDTAHGLMAQDGEVRDASTRRL